MMFLDSKDGAQWNVAFHLELQESAKNTTVAHVDLNAWGPMEPTRESKIATFHPKSKERHGAPRMSHEMVMPSVNNTIQFDDPKEIELPFYKGGPKVNPFDLDELLRGQEDFAHNIIGDGTPRDCWRRELSPWLGVGT